MGYRLLVHLKTNICNPQYDDQIQSPVDVIKFEDNRQPDHLPLLPSIRRESRSWSLPHLQRLSRKKRGKNKKLPTITNSTTNTNSSYIYSNQRNQNSVSITTPVNFPATSNPIGYHRMEPLHSRKDIQRTNQHHDDLLPNIDPTQTTFHRYRVDKSRRQIHARNTRLWMEIPLRIKFPT